MRNIEPREDYQKEKEKGESGSGEFSEFDDLPEVEPPDFQKLNQLIVSSV